MRGYFLTINPVLAQKSQTIDFAIAEIETTVTTKKRVGLDGTRNDAGIYNG